MNPNLFDFLTEVVAHERAISGLHAAFSPGTLFATEPLPVHRMSGIERCKERTAWFSRAMKAVEDADIVFADPDNGLTADDAERRLVRDFGKKMPLNELLVLAANRTAVVYHHNSRFKGGHDAEVSYWLRRIGVPTLAVRANAFSCRTFFVVNPDTATVARVGEFCERWKDHSVRLHAC